ncbi:probable ATP-dependent RNA helicase DDX20 [Acanthochromis polyacanthus]|uniref:probable ATP-dependent RNA helicase DDX20 n=1 Tax=Acanthochromis polyacanthus TaxID=80966 RepID=UPI002233F26B|nr:probable ATP-dependent RNA helicase DDX20 [Acanthochromis polyacanthus]
MAAAMRKAAHDIETRKRTDDVLLSEGIDFGSLLLSPAVLDGLSAAGFQKPSPIQLKAIPLGRCGLDLIVQAKSGTGKTCVFCTVALDSLVLENPATQVLVLAPTREIAVQIHSVVMAIGCAMEGLECHVFIGGRPVSQDKAHLKKCHIAVGSPGRIKQLIELGMLSTSSIRLFVLDEADKLLEEGSFQEQINWIFSSLPVNKQMLALSATYPESLAQHLTRYMREPTFVRLNPSDMGLKGLKQYYKLVQSHPLAHKVFEEKVQHLLELFSKIPFNQALVFSNLHTRAQQLADVLSSKGLPSVCISGGLSQDQRLEAMSKLKQYQCRVLISTDLTSRGIDAEKVNLVINLDVPQDWETYMHRIGRAGRFGTQGLAVTYCCHGEEENKMMAIAQKCDLSLSALPSTIEPGLMDEPCDWDVCAEASTSGDVSQLFSRTEKKRRTKTEASQSHSVRNKAVEHSSQRKPQKNQAAQRQGGHGEESRRKISSAEDGFPQSPPRATPTRKELQDALPKIPPLSSFKKQRSKFMTFEEAEWDFHSFITTGLGRSVEVIREFRGREDGGPSDQNEHRESITLNDDGAQKVAQNSERWKSNLSSQRLVSSSSISDVEESQDEATTGSSNQIDSAEYRAEPQTEARHAPKPKAGPTRSKASASSELRTYGQIPTSGRASSHPESRESVPSIKSSPRTNQTVPAETRREELQKLKKQIGRRRRKLSEKTKRELKRERDEEYGIDMEEEEEEEEEEWGAETYWRACYRAWNNYYTCMAPFHEHGYQSYYRAAHNWMAAYRMNAIYMEELLKFPLSTYNYDVSQ